MASLGFWGQLRILVSLGFWGSVWDFGQFRSLACFRISKQCANLPHPNNPIIPTLPTQRTPPHTQSLHGCRGCTERAIAGRSGPLHRNAEHTCPPGRGGPLAHTLPLWPKGPGSLAGTCCGRLCVPVLLARRGGGAVDAPWRVQRPTFRRASIASKKAVLSVSAVAASGGFRQPSERETSASDNPSA